MLVYHRGTCLLESGVFRRHSSFDSGACFSIGLYTRRSPSFEVQRLVLM